MSSSLLQESLNNPVTATASTTVTSTALPGNATPGSTLVAFVEWASATLPSSVVDSAGQNYSLKASAFDSNDGSTLALYVFQNNASATALTVTSTWSTAFPYLGIKLGELGGVSSASYESAVGNDQASPGTGTAAITSGPITPTNAPYIIYGLSTGDGGGASSVPTSPTFTQGSTDWVLTGSGDAASATTAWARSTSTAATALTFGNSTDGATRRFLTVAAIFKEAASPASNAPVTIPFGPGISPHKQTMFQARPLSAYIVPGNMRGVSNAEGSGRGSLITGSLPVTPGYVRFVGPGISPDYNQTFTRPPLSSSVPITAQIQGVAVWNGFGSASVNTTVSMSGLALWQGVPAQGFIYGAAALSGTTNWEGRAYGFINTGSVAAISGVAAWNGFGNAVAQGLGALQGVASWQAASNATLLGAGAMKGVCAWAGYGAAATASATAALVGSATWQLSANGNLGGAASLQGLASGQGVTAASLLGSAALLGQAIGTGYAVGAVTGSGALAGAALWQGMSFGTFLGAGQLEGVAIGQCEAVGLLLPVGSGQMHGLAVSACFSYGSIASSTYQFGYAICNALSQNGLPVAEASYIEESSCSVTLEVFNQQGVPFVPNAVQYRIDDVASGAQILNWTTITPELFMEITVTSAQNAMINQTRPWESHQVLFQVTDGLGNINYARVEFDLIRVAGLG